MKMLGLGKIDFSSCRELLEYIRSFERIECMRDVSGLRDLISCDDTLTLPTIDDDGEGNLSADEGELDEGRVEDLVEEMQAGVPDLVPNHQQDGIILEVNIGGLSFMKNGRRASWVCRTDGAIEKLPLGFAESELQDELDASDCADDIYALISEALDRAVGVDEQYRITYRMFRSVDDDLKTLGEALADLDYDGYYAEAYVFEWSRAVRCIRHNVHGWREDMEEPYEGFGRDDLIDDERPPGGPVLRTRAWGVHERRGADGRPLPPGGRRHALPR